MNTINSMHIKPLGATAQKRHRHMFWNNSFRHLLIRFACSDAWRCVIRTKRPEIAHVSRLAFLAENIRSKITHCLQCVALGLMCVAVLYGDPGRGLPEWMAEAGDFDPNATITLPNGEAIKQGQLGVCPPHPSSKGSVSAFMPCKIMIQDNIVFAWPLQFSGHWYEPYILFYGHQDSDPNVINLYSQHWC